MPLRTHSETSRHILVIAGTEKFDKLENNNLPGVPAELKLIKTTFETLGYDTLPVKADPDHNELKTLFANVKDDSRTGDHVVAYYTGHGARDEYEPNRFYLLTRNSDPANLDDTALPAEDLARALIKQSKAAQILVIIDCCYAAAGAAEVAQIVSRLADLGGAGPEIFIIAATRTKQEAEVGALSSALAETLANKQQSLGGHLQDFLFMDEVMGAVKSYLAENHPSQIANWHVNAEGSCRLFPNPRYQAKIPSGLDLETQRAFTQHWLPKAHGAEIGAYGWYFTGREQALQELTAWLKQESSEGQIRVVTGGPGSGKSAVLARLVTLSNPTYRKQILVATGTDLLDPDTLPPEGLVTIAVHARHKLLADVVAQIAAGLGLKTDQPAELIEALKHNPDKTVIVVDALDEADEKSQIVDQLLRHFGGLSQVFLLVGTRPDLSEHSRRFGAFGDSAVELDLDLPHYIGANDVACYVKHRLLATEEPERLTPYRQFPEIAHLVAQSVAKRAKNVFLVAHTAVIALLAKSVIIDISDPEWIGRLPTGVDMALAQFFDELDTRKPDGLSSNTARAALLALAFAEGEGLPWSNIWASVASAISDKLVDDADIDLVRKHAAPFIVEALESNRSVYRLYHEKVAEILRSCVNVEKSQQLIVETLRLQVSKEPVTQQPDWICAHPYLLAHLLSHAAKAKVVNELAIDGIFIAAAEPLRTLQILSKSMDPFVNRVYATYRLALHNLQHRPKEDRLSYLEMAAHQLGDDALAEVWTRQAGSRNWTVPWTHWAPLTPYRVISDASGSHSVAMGTFEGRSVIVFGGADGTVKVWDPVSGALRYEPLRGHEGKVESVTLGLIKQKPVIVSGGYDGKVRVWDLASGSPQGVPLLQEMSGVTAVALGMLEEQPVIVSGALNGIVRVWDLTTWKLQREPLQAHGLAVASVALGEIEGRPVIVSGGQDHTVRLWDLTKKLPLGKPLHPHKLWGFSIALGILKGQPVVVSGEPSGKVEVWNLVSGLLQDTLLCEDKSQVSAIALGMLNGQLAVVAGSFNGTIRVWDLASGALLGGVLRGHTAVKSVVLGMLDGQPTVVSTGFEGTVRVWDVASNALQNVLLRGDESEMTSVALGMLDNQQVVVSGGDDGIVQVWDLESGELKGPSLCGHKGAVRSVALGMLEGQSVIVSGGKDSTVRAWDLTSWKQRGAPMCGHQRGVSSLGLSMLKMQPVIVSSGGEGTVQRWDLKSGDLLGPPLRVHDGGLLPIALGMLGEQPVIVTSGYWCAVQVWNLDSGESLGVILSDEVHIVSSVALGTLKGKSVIVSGGNDGTVGVWDLASRKQQGAPLHGHENWVLSIVLGILNGQRVIISGGRDGVVRLWNEDGISLFEIPIGSEINNLALSESGAVAVAAKAGLLIFQFDFGLKTGI